MGENIKIIKQIVNKLVDMYEKSNAMKGERFNRKKLPLSQFYNGKDSQFINNLNDELIKIEKLGIIYLGKKSEGKYSEIILNVSNINDVYKYLHREKKTDKNKVLLEIIDNHINDCDESKVICEYLRNKILSNKDDDKFETPEKLQDILKGLKAVCINQEPIYRRKFSQIVYGDTKKFDAKYKNYIADLLKLLSEENLEKYEHDKDHNALIESYNIYKMPSFICIKGNARLMFNDSIINLLDFPMGFQFCGDDIDKLKSINVYDANIITIENLASFYQFEQDNYFVMYLGGFPNHIQCRFIKNYLTFDNKNYFHFGDIDKGGFWIWKTLCSKTNIDFIPYKMGIYELEEYKQYTKPLSLTDKKNLQLFKQSSNQFDEVIDYMLKNNIKLEQEIMDV